VFRSERIWSWSRIQSLPSMQKSFLIISRLCSYLILLNSGDWMDNCPGHIICQK
jgi:hypothetical protein